MQVKIGYYGQHLPKGWSTALLTPKIHGHGSEQKKNPRLSKHFYSKYFALFHSHKLHMGQCKDKIGVRMKIICLNS